MSIESNADLATVIATVTISLISGFVSIAQRIARGMAVSVIWVAGEFAAALLCGHLMWDAYPKIAHTLPEWCTHWVAVALAAHFGGRVLQFIEHRVLQRISKAMDSLEHP